MTTAQETRFWGRIERRDDDQCWPWIGGKNGDGYGRFSLGVHQKIVAAHRYAYELLVGPIPDGMVLDHLCRNRACVNPAHLEVVTHQENILRGNGHAADNARKTHCSNGHEFTEASTKWVIRQGQRVRRRCRLCDEAASRARTEKEQAYREVYEAAKNLRYSPDANDGDVLVARDDFHALAAAVRRVDGEA